MRSPSVNLACRVQKRKRDSRVIWHGPITAGRRQAGQRLLTQELEQAGKKFLVERVSAVAPSPKVPLLPLVAEGDPAEALLIAAKDANLLVLGTSGRTRLAGFLLGSVSSRCAAAAQCPVLLVKAPPGTAET